MKKKYAERGSLGIVGPSRVNGENNPDYHRQYYALHREKLLAANYARNKARGYFRGITHQHYKAIAVSLLIQRDGDKCGICGLALGNDVTIDHIRPKCLGGKDEGTNLQLAHWECNKRKRRSKWQQSDL